MTLDCMKMLTIVILPIHEHEISFHLQAYLKLCMFNYKPLQYSDYYNKTSHMNFYIPVYISDINTILYSIKCAIVL